jgi:hypothetical protein
MTHVTPGSASQIQLEDGEAYEAVLVGVEVERGRKWDDQSEPSDQVKLVWQIGDDEENTLWTFFSLRLGINRTTKKPARLRQILNALAGRPEGDEIAWVDDGIGAGAVFGEWAYPDGKMWSLCASGEFLAVDGSEVYTPAPNLRVLVRCENQVTENGTRAVPVMWRPVKRAPATIAAARPKPAAVDPEDIPF